MDSIKGSPENIRKYCHSQADFVLVDEQFRGI
jgi:hypothetical protein